MLTLYKDKFLKTEFGSEMINCINCWEKAINEKDFQKSIFFQGQWEVYQLALKQFYGIDYSFTRTNDYYGIVKNDESDWLYKIEK